MKTTGEQEFAALVDITCALLASGHYTEPEGEGVTKYFLYSYATKDGSSRSIYRYNVVRDAIDVLDQLMEHADDWISPCDEDGVEPNHTFTPPFEPQ